MIDELYIGNSDGVTRLIERVEATFIKHFASSNRSKGMNILRPKSKKEKHRMTFSLGFLTGCSVVLLATLILILHIRKILEMEGFGQYMENMFPLYRFVMPCNMYRRHSDQDENCYNARRGVDLSLKRAEKARVAVNKLPGTTVVPAVGADFIGALRARVNHDEVRKYISGVGMDGIGKKLVNSKHLYQ